MTYSQVKDANGFGPGGKSTLSVWEVLPTDKALTPIARWDISGTDDRPGIDEPWARLVTGDLVLSRSGDNGIALWDIAKKSLRYQLTQEAHMPDDPTLSPGRKYLFVPERRSVRIHEAESGALVSVLPTERDAIAVGISNDGRRAVVQESNQLAIWDLTAADAKPTLSPTAGTAQSREGGVMFLTEDRVLLTTRGFMVLYGLKEGVPLWSYLLLEAGIKKNSTKVLAPLLVYSAKLRGNGGLAVGAVKFPGPGVDQAATKANRETAYLLKPGVAVKLDVQAGEHTAAVKAALEKKIAANGWKITPEAAIVITAEMKLGQQQSITYQTTGLNPTKTTVSLVPHITSLNIKSGESVAWTSGSSTGAPFFVRLEEGQTLQGEVDKWQKPDPAFFDKTDIPREILDPTKARGFGTSRVSSQGLEIIQSPPGQP